MTQAASAVITERVTGYVERTGRKGFGFIVTPDKRRVFFHIRNVSDRSFPNPGEIVVAEILPQKESAGNYRALSVRRIEVPK